MSVALERLPPVRPRRLVALVQKVPGVAPHQRFRIEQWLPRLANEHGVTVELLPFESPALTEVLYEQGARSRKARLLVRDAVRRWHARAELLRTDGVIVVRESGLLGGAWLERWLARHGMPLIYDFDDAIWRPVSSAANGIFALARAPWKVKQICRLASAVTVGNAYLADYARQFNQNVHVVRTSVDLARFGQAPEPPSPEPFRLVWTGTHSTLAHLEHIRPALEAVGATRPTVLRVVCDREPSAFQNVRTEFVRWSAAREAADLVPSHVGIMPLPDDPWTRGKCGCKALQYMAVGRAVVVSPVGMNTELVRHDETGLLAATQDDWVRQLLRLADDPGLRRRLADAGRRTVVREFSADAAADRFASVVAQVLDGAAR